MEKEFLLKMMDQFLKKYGFKGKKLNDYIIIISFNYFYFYYLTNIILKKILIKFIKIYNS